MNEKDIEELCKNLNPDMLKAAEEEVDRIVEELASDRTEGLPLKDLIERFNPYPEEREPLDEEEQ